MKVVCIAEVTINSKNLPPIIKVGEYYKVIETHIIRNRLFYELSEDPSTAYMATLFAPVSDIDETTFERNYKKESV